jgi:hypothetical protein
VPPYNPAARGFLPLWRSGDACPGCGAGHWYVGAITAECAWCATALPLLEPRTVPSVVMGRRGDKGRWVPAEWRR